jgi:hypothetical protein
MERMFGCEVARIVKDVRVAASAQGAVCLVVRYSPVCVCFFLRIGTLLCLTIKYARWTMGGSTNKCLQGKKKSQITGQVATKRNK